MAARILVTGSSTFFATRLIHGLGKLGAEVTAADSLPISAGKCARHTRRRVLLPKLATQPGAYLAAVRRELETRSYDLLLPTFEEGLLFAEYQSELRERTNVFLPPFETMMQLHHKPSLHQLCLKWGVPTPPTQVVRDARELNAIAESLGYPLVLKLPASNNSVGRTYCDDAASLQRNYARLSAEQAALHGEPPFLQKKIQGELIYTLCLCHEGQKLGEVIYCTRRTFPEQGGTAAHRESIAHPEIARQSARLCAAANWTGFLGLDFIVDRETGIPYLIDANVRANPAVHLGYLAGIDWSQCLLDLLAGRTPQPALTQPGINAHTMLLYGGCLFESLFPHPQGWRAWGHRLAEVIRPGWRIDSHDDLLAVGEYASTSVLLGHGIYCLLKSVATGRQVGQLLLDHASYDSATAAVLRCERTGSHEIPALAALEPQAA